MKSIGFAGCAALRALSIASSTLALVAGIAIASPASAQDKPNIVVIMGDDIGVWNVGAYHRGMMAGLTPNLDKLAAEGAIFTDYYAEASCTAGRAAFITGELPIRTGLTTVGQAGATIGMPAAAPTIATVLKEMGYATGQFGKNHLGDLNPYLPTVHGFDEFFGYLYHLDAMSDPFQPNYPQDLWATVGPRNLLHTWATDTNDPTVDPRWGEVGMQKIVDEGPLAPHPTDGVKYDMETVDDHFLAASLDFMERAKADGKPFFLWLNPTRMHVFTYLSPKYEAMRTAENGWSVQEAGMAQFDDIVGSVMAKLDEMGVAENTIVVFTTDNGAEVMTWPDGGMTPFRGEKGMATEGGFRAPAIIRWPGHVEPNQVINGVMSAIDWLPTFAAAAGMPDIGADLLQGRELNGTEYKVHLDGYDQTALLTEGAPSARNEFWYFIQTELGAVRIGDYKFTLKEQPDGWVGPVLTYNAPRIYNLRLDPFERAGIDPHESLMNFENFYGQVFWRFVQLQQEVAKLAQTAIAYPPMQEGASFNLDAVKQKIRDAAASSGQ